MVGRVAILCGVVCGCGSSALTSHPDGAVGVDVADDSAWSVRFIYSLVGTMAFNELLNDGYDASIVPSWTSPGLRSTEGGQVTGSITTTFAGPLPDSDTHRDILFWNVSGDYPFQQDAQTIPLSATRGVIASSSTAGSAVFALAGSFDTTIRSPQGDSPGRINVGLTWVRAYLKGGVSYQVLPGSRQPFDVAHELTWEGELKALSGSFGYYVPLSDDTPGLGADFDYPAWIRAHVTW